MFFLLNQSCLDLVAGKLLLVKRRREVLCYAEKLIYTVDFQLHEYKLN